MFMNGFANLNKVRAFCRRCLANGPFKRESKIRTKHLAAAARLCPGNEKYALDAVAASLNAGDLPMAMEIGSEMARQNDPGHYWRLFESYLQELSVSDQEKPCSDHGKNIALFNDTDRRPNIGCRLTSRSFKGLIRKAYPGCSISSLAFHFGALRTNSAARLLEQSEGVLENLQVLVLEAYGNAAGTKVRDADMVILQGEGSLDDQADLHGLLTFFSPILLAVYLGKPVAIANGTIPRYEGNRHKFIKSLFDAVGSVARDQMTADSYGIPFMADAALVYDPPPFSGPRADCLITTGARNHPDEDRRICSSALATCRELGLRPVVLTRACVRFAEFRDEIESLGGIYADTASLELAAEIVSKCCLHIGGRYHMAILCLVCGVPSLLFDVKTEKNRWLGSYSPLIQLVGPEYPLSPAARKLIPRAGEYPSPRDGMIKDYIVMLHQAVGGPASNGREVVTDLICGLRK